MLAVIFAVLATALSAAAILFSERASDSLVHIPLTKGHRDKTASNEGRINIPAANRARAATLKYNVDGRGSKPASIDATNNVFVDWTATIGAGSPNWNYTLLIDTGSSNTWTNYYNVTNTSTTIYESLQIYYGSGSMSGVLYYDDVTLGDNIVLRSQGIGSASVAYGFYDVDGVLGLGPRDLTVGTILSSKETSIPTVTETALAQGYISTEVLAVSLAPASSKEDTNGLLTFGGVHPSKFIGEINYVPVTTTHPASRYWGINVTQVVFGSTTIFNQSHAGIVDTGTSLVLIANDFFQTYADAIPGSSVDQTTGLLMFPESSIPSIPSLNFTIGGVEYELTADAQLIPKWQYNTWGCSDGVGYSIIAPLGTVSGDGYDFILGETFLERFYAVFDTTHHRVGLAYTDHTYVIQRQ